jgi:hypothetical protein
MKSEASLAPKIQAEQAISCFEFGGQNRIDFAIFQR